MSDQTPPGSTDQQPPAEPPTTEIAAEPPPPEKAGRGRLLAIVAGVLVLVLIAGGLGAFFLLRSDNHEITTPSTAGSMKRDKDEEKELSSDLDLAVEQFKKQGGGKGENIRYVRSAVFTQDDDKRGPSGALVFLGAKLSKEQDPEKWVSEKFAKHAKTNGYKITTIDPGDGGGKGACATITSPQKVAICAWATKDTIGELVPLVPGYDAEALAKIMRDLRSDVEKPE